MKIKYLTKSGRLVEPSKVMPKPHLENLKILEVDPVGGLIFSEVLRIVEDFSVSSNPYVHSGQAARKVCEILGLEQNAYYHGLVGSALNKTFGDFASDVYVVASKGDDQKWFDYFSER